MTQQYNKSNGTIVRSYHGPRTMFDYHDIVDATFLTPMKFCKTINRATNKTNVFKHDRDSTDISDTEEVLVEEFVFQYRKHYAVNDSQQLR